MVYKDNAKEIETSFQKFLREFAETGVIAPPKVQYVEPNDFDKVAIEDDDVVYVRSDDHYECGCCKCCGCDCYQTKKLSFLQVLRMRMRLNKEAK